MQPVCWVPIYKYVVNVSTVFCRSRDTVYISGHRRQYLGCVCSVATRVGFVCVGEPDPLLCTAAFTIAVEVLFLTGSPFSTKHIG